MHLWPWFLGALALGSVAVLYTAVTGRGFGVSGHIGRVTGGEAGRGRSALFLGGIALGGLLAAVSGGPLALHGLDAGYAHLFGGGLGAGAALFGGGLLVGAGTAVAGGCTSGHGLVGCARLQPGSLASTAAFLGTAVAITFVLAGVLS